MSTATQALQGVIDLLTKFYESPSLAHTNALALIDKELPILRAALAEARDDAQPVGSILKGNLKQAPGPWCREVLLYSPDNQGDSPEHRVMLYTAGRLSEALDYAEKGLAEWRDAALSAQRLTRQSEARAKLALDHLDKILNGCRTAAEQQAADNAGREFLQACGR